MRPDDPTAMEQALRRLYTADVPDGFEAGWRAAIEREEYSMTENKQHQPLRRTLWRAALSAAAVLVLTLGSLWVGAEQPENAAVQQSRGVDGAAMSAKYAVSSNSAAGVYEEDAPADTLEMMAADYGMSGASDAALPAAPEPVAEGEAEGEARKLVRTVDITLRSNTFDADAQSVQALMDETGAYAENMYQRGDADDHSRRLMLSLRVPTDKLDGFLTGIEGIGRVESRSESVTDMTLDYTDTQARLNTLYQKRERLDQLLATAETVSDLVEIESAISDTQYQIDLYESRRRTIDRDVDMTAVSVSLMEETPAQSAIGQATLGERLRAALTASVQGVGQFLRNMLVFVTMALPVLVPLAIALVAWRLIRRKKRAAPKEE